jgi:hypothetical protein
MRQPTCARPVSDRHAQPDWIGAGSESRQTMHRHSCGSMPAEAIRTSNKIGRLESTNGQAGGEKRQTGGGQAPGVSTGQRVSCVRVCRGRAAQSCSGAACRFTSQSPLQPGWAALLVSGRVCPWLRSRAVGRRGGGEPFAADSGAGRWSALNTQHSVQRKSLCRLMAPSILVAAACTRYSNLLFHKDCQVIPFQPVSQPD